MHKETHPEHKEIVDLALSRVIDIVNEYRY